MGIFDVPPTHLINAIAGDLQKKYRIEKPPFTVFVKTGSHRERAPHQENWWWTRMGSLLYRLYREGPTGVGSFRTYYGGRKNRGTKPHKHRKASGKIIRWALLELEKAGLVKKTKKGRMITAQGESLLFQKSKEILGKWKEKEQKRLAEEKRKRLEYAKKTAKEPVSHQKKKKGKKETETKEKKTKTKKRPKSKKK
jgi:small subunit ribosomal protein S19e